MPAGMIATAVGLAGYSHAKERLIADGMDRERVEKMSVGQVIAIYTERIYRGFADDSEHLWQVPFADPKNWPLVEKKVAAAKPFGSGVDREFLPMATLLLPALQASRQAQMRLDREVASLRVIEALRMYAAEHDGRCLRWKKLPGSRAEQSGDRKTFCVSTRRRDGRFGIAADRWTYKRQLPIRNPNSPEE